MTKTPAEIELMAEAGRLLASVFTYLDDIKHLVLRLFGVKSETLEA